MLNLKLLSKQEILKTDLFTLAELPILGIRNTCAASACLIFPDVPWENVDNFVVSLIGLTSSEILC